MYWIMVRLLFDKISYLRNYFSYLKNPLDALKFKCGFKDSCILKIKKYNKSIHLANVFSLDEYDFSPNILKMDCEGCEFGIIEHHSKFFNKYYNVLIGILKKGFVIDCYNLNVHGLNFGILV